MKELDFIAALRGLATHPAARGLADDAAVLDFGGETLVLTHDAMVEGRHWLPGQNMADVAWKLVAVNLSDLAAKGAEPLGVLIGHTLGDGDERFLAGLREILERYDVPLLGGDTVAGGGARTLGCTAIGRATHRPVPGRDGAQVGDLVCVTGPVGAAMMGYDAIRAQSGGTIAYRRPEPLLEAGRTLAPHVSAMMDVSDGLLLDAKRMALASGVTIAIDRAAVPIAAPEDRRDEALRWGDDYQLLFTLPENLVQRVPAGLLHCVGRVATLERDPLLIDGQPPADSDALGYQH